MREPRTHGTAAALTRMASHRCQHGREQILALELLDEEVRLLAVWHGRPASGPSRQHTIVVLVRPGRNEVLR